LHEGSVEADPCDSPNSVCEIEGDTVTAAIQVFERLLNGHCARKRAGQINIDCRTSQPPLTNCGIDSSI